MPPVSLLSLKMLWVHGHLVDKGCPEENRPYRPLTFRVRGWDSPDGPHITAFTGSRPRGGHSACCVRDHVRTHGKKPPSTVPLPNRVLLPPRGLVGTPPSNSARRPCGAAVGQRLRRDHVSGPTRAHDGTPFRRVRVLPAAPGPCPGRDAAPDTDVRFAFTPSFWDELHARALVVETARFHVTP